MRPWLNRCAGPKLRPVVAASNANVIRKSAAVTVGLGIGQGSQAGVQG